MKEIVWTSPNKHIVIVRRKSYFNQKDTIFSIFRETRNYKFKSTECYDTEWNFCRWEAEFSDAINYAEQLSDSICVR